MPTIVPPGGFAGFAQMTPATRVRFGQITRSRGPSRRRRRKSSAPKAARRSKKRANGSRGPKFGSPAWRKKYKLGIKRAARR